MELTKNFKKTEFGDFPKQWDIKTIQSLIEDNSITGHLDGNHGELYPRSDEFKEDGIPYITANDLTGAKVDFSHCKYLSPKRASTFKKGIAKNGDVLFAHNATVGPTGLLSTDLDYVILSTTATYYRCNLEKINNRFLLYLLQSPMFVRQYRSVMAQSTRFQVPITTQRKLSIFLPESKEEQESIANALSDIDTYIESLEKLIAKKRLLKKGVLQKLLKPQEHWEHKTLGEIGVISGAGVDKLIKKEETPVRLLNFMDVFRRDFIYSDELIHWVTAPSTKARNCAIQKGDVFFTPSSEMRYDIAVSAIAMEDISDAVYSYHLIRFRLNEDWDLNFRNYVFKTRYFFEQAETLCEGSGKRYVLTLPKFRSLKIYYPKSKSEQFGISSVLSDIDEEINSLHNKLQKARLLKQGMMQELLSGRIRLV